MDQHTRNPFPCGFRYQGRLIWLHFSTPGIQHSLSHISQNNNSLSEAAAQQVLQVSPAPVAVDMVVLRAGLCPGLTEEMIQLLRANGIRTVVDFVSSDLEDVAQKCSLSYKALVAVRRVLLAQFSAFPANGADLYEELKSSTAILPTGNPSLDQLLDSGLYTGEVTELMGAPGSGKTQVCLGIAASVSLSLKQHVLFLDSTGGFIASRLYQMLQAQTEDEEEQLEALQRIQVARVFDVYEVLSALQELRDRLSQQVMSSTGPLKIVVIDSVSAVIYPLLGGRQSEGLAIMMQLSRELKTLAREFSLAVVVTNQVTRDSSTGPLKPALGRSWSFVPSTRVLLESKEASWDKGTTRRVAALAKSPRQPTGLQVELDIGNGDMPEPSPVTPTQGL
ncbi:PREDICTED: DNA repair protein RAD51 homolog 4 isoform X1 [Lepidothrix coronata]|uniref:DNA repair protein RAD51 homolog 4 n=2 Tax=Lepidothrix coronata TaxID=321398 RepID=A0A6J0IEB4_9PASS|nr:PREDICTED: DNA repair protein RAD51 homolog 4 isoform X1 [Lepidothrix coronata]XP_017684406.1 PREDICTED: DNA repair protein RAD51 homolog 4 isoform X1 [Lepidothrix coronata]